MQSIWQSCFKWSGLITSMQHRVVVAFNAYHAYNNNIQFIAVYYLSQPYFIKSAYQIWNNVSIANYWWMTLSISLYISHVLSYICSRLDKNDDRYWISREQLLGGCNGGILWKMNCIDIVLRKFWMVCCKFLPLYQYFIDICVWRTCESPGLFLSSPISLHSLTRWITPNSYNVRCSVCPFYSCQLTVSILANAQSK